MASAYSRQSGQVGRTLILMSAYLAIVLAICGVLAWHFHSPIILYIGLGIAILVNFSSYWFADSMVMGMAGAREVTREEYFDCYNALENIAISIGQPMPKLYVIEDNAPNAFATGRDPKHASVAVTTGLLALLDKAELEGVLAHEMAHIQNRDTLLMMVTAILLSTVTFILDMAIRVGSSDSDNKHPLITIVVLLASYILLPIVLTIVQLAISRNREFLADATGAIYTRHPDGLARALEKISKASQPMAVQNSAIAHLYIADATPSEEEEQEVEKQSFFTKIFSTHPPTVERLKALRAM